MDDRAKFLKRKVMGKIHMDKYVAEIKAIINKPFNPEDLLSIEETDAFLSKKKDLEGKKHYKSKPLLFDNKLVLCNYILDISNAKNGELILFTMYSDYCGALKLKNLHEFNFNFSFKDEHAGIITLYLSDCSNKVIFDFWEENGQELIEIEAWGSEWGSIKVDLKDQC